MRAVVLFFDSLNRKGLSPYGADPGMTPNFKRLSERSATFDQSYVCSMPCMPARRDLQTGRPDLFHRPWGPLEPFDHSVPEILEGHGIRSHLVTDHYHYFEEGGQNYHTKYSTWEFHRGQEGDPWIPDYRSNAPLPPHDQRGGKPEQQRQDLINRQQTSQRGKHTQDQCFDSAETFLRKHGQTDNWFLQVECFDPHEPFFAGEQHRGEDPVTCDWPQYGQVDETNQGMLLERYQKKYGESLRHCDASLGRILDLFDELNLWDDTLLIVGTDHGFLLGEHGYLAKNVMPLWDEIAHTPLFVWDPRHPHAAGQRRQSLAQIIDWGPTLLEYFGKAVPGEMVGKPMSPILEDDTPIRETAIFGYYGLHVNITDGHYVYMRPRNREIPLFAYTLDPAHMEKRYSMETLQAGAPNPGFSFSRGVPLMRYPMPPVYPDSALDHGELLYDLEKDPGQRYPMEDRDIKDRLLSELKASMRVCEAPPEQYESLGL